MWTVIEKNSPAGGSKSSKVDAKNIVKNGGARKRKRSVGPTRSSRLKETDGHEDRGHVIEGTSGHVINVDESKWRRVNLEDSKMFAYDDMAQGLISIEEMDLGDVEGLEVSNEEGSGVKKVAPVKGKKKGRKNKKKSEKKKVEIPVAEEASGAVDPVPALIKDPFEGVSVEDKEAHDVKWREMGVPDELIGSLLSSGKLHPTEVQTHSIPAILRDRKDVMVASQTGSGKTLAFGLPILSFVLGEVKRGCRARDLGVVGLILEPTRELAMQVYKHLTEVSVRCPKGSINVCPIVGGISMEKQQRLVKSKPQIVVATPGRLWEILKQGGKDGCGYLRSMRNVKYLVLDEADRMLEQGHFAELRHILEYIPKLEPSGEENDGGDKGDFEDPDELDIPDFHEFESASSGAVLETGMPMEEAVEVKPTNSRQTMIFSATLCLKKDFYKPRKVSTKKKGKQVEADVTPEEQTLERLLRSIDIQKKPKVIDLSTKTTVASNVFESKIDCVVENKDHFLYYFLQLYGGRSIVFCNSISCIRRLLPIFSLLFEWCKDVSVVGLHANMQQRQRLKNLERFKNSPRGILITTDVSARGLDIAAVNHVVHYQIPRDADTYVHRAGRTARGEGKKGVSLALVSPDDAQSYKKIVKTLQKENGIQDLEVNLMYMPNVKRRVKLARKIDEKLHLKAKQKSRNDWIKRAAEEMDIIVDEDVLGDTKSNYEDDAMEKKKENAIIEGLKRELKKELDVPLLPTGMSKKYLTANTMKDMMVTKKPATQATNVDKLFEDAHTSAFNSSVLKYDDENKKIAVRED
eukprot:Nk52_evm8s244 gene=Nk52_evmTU8s244